MYENRIERGAAWLDEHHPGWRDKVNVDTLDLSDCTMCVLGQLSGQEGDNWPTVVRSFDLTFAEVNSLGFSLIRFLDDSMDGLFVHLTNEWKQYLTTGAVT